MVGNGQSQVGDGHHDGDLVLGHQEPHQACLEYIGWEEREKDDDQGEDEADILDTEIENYRAGQETKKTLHKNH